MRFSEKTKREALEACQAFEKVGCEIPHSSMCMIVRLAKMHHRIQERWCSEEMSDFIQKRTEAKEKNIEKRIAQIAEANNLKAHFDGDPPGFSVKLHVKEGQRVWNTWGGAETGYGVGET